MVPQNALSDPLLSQSLPDSLKDSQASIDEPAEQNSPQDKDSMISLQMDIAVGAGESANTSPIASVRAMESPESISLVTPSTRAGKVRQSCITESEKPPRCELTSQDLNFAGEQTQDALTAPESTFSQLSPLPSLSARPLTPTQPVVQDAPTLKRAYHPDVVLEAVCPSAGDLVAEEEEVYTVASNPDVKKPLAPHASINR